MDDTPLESIKRSKKHIQYSGPPPRISPCFFLLTKELFQASVTIIFKDPDTQLQDFHGYIPVVATSNFILWISAMRRR